MKWLERVKCLTALLLGLCVAGAQAQEWPSRPIRLIVPFPAGQTASDQFPRFLAERLSVALKQAVVVENRPGAGGTVGAASVAKAPPDGYTLLAAATGTITIAPSVYGAKMPFNPLTDLAPISLFAVVPYMLVVPASLSVRNVQEFIALAKSKPGALNFGSSGNGTTPHLCGERFKRQAGIDIVHVPYKGGAVAQTDLLAGRLQLYCTGGPASIVHVKAGNLRVIGLTMPERSPVLPDVPTLAEQGVAGMDDINSWVGLFAPAGTPPAIINRLYTEVARIMAMPDMRQLIADQASESLALSPAEFAQRIRRETAVWSEVVKATGATSN